MNSPEPYDPNSNVYVAPTPQVLADHWVTGEPLKLEGLRDRSRVLTVRVLGLDRTVNGFQAQQYIMVRVMGLGEGAPGYATFLLAEDSTQIEQLA